jgi:hypothetical protein
MFIGDIYPGFTSTTQQPLHSMPIKPCAINPVACGTETSFKQSAATVAGPAPRDNRGVFCRNVEPDSYEDLAAPTPLRR